MTSVNQGLFSTTMEAEKRDPGNQVGWILVKMIVSTTAMLLRDYLLALLRPKEPGPCHSESYRVQISRDID